MENVLLQTVSTLVGLVDSYLLFSLLGVFFNSNFRPFLKPLFILLFYAVLFICAQFDSPLLNLVIPAVAAFLVAIFLFEGGILSRIFCVVGYYLIMISSEAVVVLIANTVHGISLQELSLLSIKNIPYVISSRLLPFVLLHILIQFFGRKRARLPVVDFISLMLLAFASLTVTASQFLSFYISGQQVKILSIISSIILFIANIVVFTMYIRSLEYHRLKSEHALLTNTLLINSKKYDEIESVRQDMLLMWHDIENHISTAKAMMVESPEKSHDYLNDLEQKALQIKRATLASGESMVDAVVYLKTRKAEEHGIRTDIILDMNRQLPIRQLDLCSIFTNALDNAIEATTEVEGDKWIKLRAVQQGQMLRINVVNPSKHRSLNKADGQFHTTKPVKDFHGLGLRSIQCVAEQYQGWVNASYKNNVFQLSVLLNINDCTNA